MRLQMYSPGFMTNHHRYPVSRLALCFVFPVGERGYRGLVYSYLFVASALILYLEGICNRIAAFLV
jgi:hypothetical protein